MSSWDGALPREITKKVERNRGLPWKFFEETGRMEAHQFLNQCFGGARVTRRAS